MNGVAGDLLRAQGRHNMRPAHIHFLICKPGYKTQFSQVYSSDDPNLETDAQFGVTRALVGSYDRQMRAGAICARPHVRDRAGGGDDAGAADYWEGELAVVVDVTLD